MSEAELQRQILDWLATVPGVDAWRQNSGVAKMPGGRVRFGHVGSGDISGILRGGRRLEIEVKTPTGKVSEAQERFGRRINVLGGLWVCVRSLQEAMDAVNAALEEVR